MQSDSKENKKIPLIMPNEVKIVSDLRAMISGTNMLNKKFQNAIKDIYYNIGTKEGVDFSRDTYDNLSTSISDLWFQYKSHQISKVEMARRFEGIINDYRQAKIEATNNQSRSPSFSRR